MTRHVGQQQRDEFESDPVRAYHRGRRLDGLLSSAMPPVPQGVVRATHRILNEMDDQRAVQAARRLNSAD